MKSISRKALAIVLSVVLAVVALPVSVGAEGTVDFKDASKWQIVPFQGSEPHTSAPTLSTEKSFENSGSSIMVKRINGTGYGMEFNIEKEKNYKLTFSVLHENTGGGNAKLLGAWVVTNLADAAATKTPENIVADFGILQPGPSGQWATYSKTFAAGTNETVGFVVKVPDASWNNSYLDGFKLEEVEELEIDPDPDSDFEDPANWRWETINGEYTSEALTKNINSAYISDGKTSLCAKGADGTANVMDFAVEPNTNYSLSFQYKANSTKDNQYTISEVAIAKDFETAHATNKNWGLDGETIALHSVYSDPQYTFAIANNSSWSTETITFNSGDNTSVALIVVNGKLGWDSIYFDNFKLEKTYAPDSDFENPANWRWEAVQSGYTSDSNYFKLNSSKENFITKGSTSLKLIGAVGTANVIDFEVIPNTEYILSFQYKADSTKNEYTFRQVAVAKDFETACPEPDWSLKTSNLIQYHSIYADAQGTPHHLLFAKANLGAWAKETLTFNSGDNTSLALIINNNALDWNDIYFDDFQLTALIETPGNKKIQDFENYTEADSYNIEEDELGNKYYNLEANTSIRLYADDNSWTEGSANSLIGRYAYISFDMSSDRWEMDSDSEGWGFLWTEFRFTSKNAEGNMLSNGHYSSDFASAISKKVTPLEGNWRRYSFYVDLEKLGAFTGIVISRMGSHEEQTLWIDNLYVKIVTENDIIARQMFYTEEKAAIRSGDETGAGQGIRIKSMIAKDQIESRNIVEYGTIVIPEMLLDVDEELTMGNVKNGIGVAYDSTTGKDIVYSETDTHKYFTGVLVNIPTQHYGSYYVVRCYAKDADGNYYYGEEITVCVYDIVKAIMDSPEPEPGEAYTQWLNDVGVAQNIINENPEAYELWKSLFA